MSFVNRQKSEESYFIQKKDQKKIEKWGLTSEIQSAWINI